MRADAGEDRGDHTRAQVNRSELVAYVNECRVGRKSSGSDLVNSVTSSVAEQEISLRCVTVECRVVRVSAWTQQVDEGFRLTWCPGVVMKSN
jgi:hypothetical protein